MRAATKGDAILEEVQTTLTKLKNDRIKPPEREANRQH
jgi:hypothetical protein